MDHPMHKLLAALSIAVPGVLFAPAVAFADPAAAARCRAGLNAEATLIYDKVLPLVTPTTVLRDMLKDQTRSMVMAGSVDMGTARASATAAGECLRDLRD